MIYRMLRFFYSFLLLFISLSLISAQDILDDELKNRLENLPENIRNDVMDKISTKEITEELPEITNSLNVSNNEKISTINDEVYGFSLFSNLPSDITPISDLPIKSDLILSEGDYLEVFINGSLKHDGIEKFRVALDGTIRFKDFGQIAIGGLTIIEAENKIKQFLSDFILFNDVILTITELSVVEVFVFGAVKFPGSYRLNPLSSIISALQYAGGISEYGSLRNIELNSKGKITRFDLYDYLIQGDAIEQTAIKSGDIIFVKPRNNIIDISGEVIRPGRYEVLDESSLDEIIDLALGYNEVADLENSYIETYQEEILDKNSLSQKSINSIKSVNVPYNFETVNSGIRIIGPTLGNKIFKNTNLNIIEIINSLNFSDKVYPYFSLLITKNALSDSTYSVFPFSLVDSSTYSSLEERSNNSIVIFFKSSDFLSINDEVNLQSLSSYEHNLMNQSISDHLIRLKGDFYNEGKSYPVVGNFDVSTFINYVGGIRDGAEKDNIQLVDFANNNSKKINLGTVNMYSANGNLSLTAPSTKKELISVRIAGEVKYPGLYEMLPGETLFDLYQKAGLFTKEASEESIIFIRDSIKESEKKAIMKSRSDVLDAIINNLTNASLVTSNNNVPISKELIDIYNLTEGLNPVGRLVGDLELGGSIVRDLKLEDKDYIFVPRAPSTVSIAGEVLSPITTSFKKDSELNDYIKFAGGYNAYADKNSIYIIRSNGESIPVKSNIFTGGKVVIEPGDTIVVPRDIEKLSTIPMLSVATKIISEIAFAAASLNAIQN